MKTLARSLLLLLIIAVMYTGSLKAHVQLDYPQGGEYFTAGEMITITWTLLIGHDQNNWDLLYSANGGTTWDTLAANLPVEQMEYQWEVPYISSSEARIKIFQDNNGVDYEYASGNFSINLEPTGSISEDGKEFNDSFRIFPTPFTHRLHFTFYLESVGITSFSIFNMQGRKLAGYQSGLLLPGENRFTWHAADLPKGHYLYRFHCSEGTRTGTLVKTK